MTTQSLRTLKVPALPYFDSVVSQPRNNFVVIVLQAVYSLKSQIEIFSHSDFKMNNFNKKSSATSDRTTNLSKCAHRCIPLLGSEWQVIRERTCRPFCQFDFKDSIS